MSKDELVVAANGLPALKRMQYFNRYLECADPMTQEVGRIGVNLGLALYQENALPAYKEASHCGTMIIATVNAILAILLCDNGKRTRAALLDSLGNLYKYMKELNTTVKRINNDPQALFGIRYNQRTEELNRKIEQLAKAVDTFLQVGDKPGTDHAFSRLRAYADELKLSDISLTEVVSLTGKARGREGEKLLDRIAPVIYEERQAGLSWAGAVQAASNHFKRYGDQEAVDRINEEYAKQNSTDAVKRFGRNMYNKQRQKIGVLE